MVKVETLSRVPVFTGLTESELMQIAGCFTSRRLHVNENLYVEGEPAREACILLEGELGAYSALPGGGEVQVGTIVAPSLVGEMALVAGGYRTATVRCEVEARVLRISSTSFRASLDQSSISAFRVLNLITLSLGERLWEVHKSILGFWAAGERTEAEPCRSGDSVAGRGALDQGFEIRRYLPRLRFFDAFTTESIDELLDQCEPRLVPAGQYVLREGEPAGECFIVVRGAFERSVDRAGRHQLEVLGPGRLCGGDALIRGTAHLSDARCRNDTSVLVLDSALFDKLFHGRAGPALPFQRTVSIDQLSSLRNANNLLTTLTSQLHIRRRRHGRP